MLPLFVLDERLLGVSERRAKLLGSALRDLDRSLQRLGSRLVVRRGDPVAETVRAVREHAADAVFLSEDVSAYAQRRERLLAANLDVRTFPGVTVIPPGSIAPDGKDCYLVFTPYARAWAAAPRRAIERPPRRLRLRPEQEPVACRRRRARRRDRGAEAAHALAAQQRGRLRRRS